MFACYNAKTRPETAFKTTVDNSQERLARRGEHRLEACLNKWRKPRRGEPKTRPKHAHKEGVRQKRTQNIDAIKQGREFQTKGIKQTKEPDKDKHRV